MFSFKIDNCLVVCLSISILFCRYFPPRITCNVKHMQILLELFFVLNMEEYKCKSPAIKSEASQ